MLQIILTEISKNQVEILVTRTSKAQTETNKHTVSSKSLRSFAMKWRKLYLRENAATDSNQNSYERVKIFGREFAHFLFPENAVILETEQSVTIIADAQYLSLPFEILPCSDSLLCENATILRSLKARNKRERVNRKGLKKAILLANLNEHPHLRDGVIFEQRTAFKNIKKVEVETYFAEKITVPDLQLKLQSSSIFQYGGHAASTHIPLWNNQKLRAEEIKNLDLSGLEIVFISSCDSSFTDGKSNSLAEAFIFAGANQYFGYSLPITNQQALFINKEFWQNIAKGQKPYVAAQRARLAARDKFGFSDLGWLGFHCYSNVNLSVSNGTQKPLRWFLAAALGVLLIGFAFYRYGSAQYSEIGEGMREKAVVTQPKSKHQTKSPEKESTLIRYRAPNEINSWDKQSDEASRNTVNESNSIQLKKIYLRAKQDGYNTLNKQCGSIMNSFVILYQGRFLDKQNNLTVERRKEIDWRLKQYPEILAKNGCFSVSKNESSLLLEIDLDPKREAKMKELVALVNKNEYKVPIEDCYRFAHSFSIWFKSWNELKAHESLQLDDSGAKPSIATQLQVLNRDWDKLTLKGCVK